MWRDSFPLACFNSLSQTDSFSFFDYQFGQSLERLSVASHCDRYAGGENAYHWIGDVCSTGKWGGLDSINGGDSLRHRSNDDLLFGISKEVCREFYVKRHEGLIRQGPQCLKDLCLIWMGR